VGEEDQWHVMFKLRDGEAETAVELGSSVVSSSNTQQYTPLSDGCPFIFTSLLTFADLSLHYLFCKLISPYQHQFNSLSRLCPKGTRGLLFM